MQNSFIAGLLLGTLLVCGCDDSPPPMTPTPGTGFLSVGVRGFYDPDRPMAGIEITVNPVNRSAVTDSTGDVRFELEPGDYVIDTLLPLEAGFLYEFHEPVFITAGETTRVTFGACENCFCAPRLRS